MQELLQDETINGIPWDVLKDKKNDPNFDFKGFVDSLNFEEMEKLMYRMEEPQTMEGRVVEAVELMGMVPKLVKQGGITVKEKNRIDKIMRNFKLTKHTLQSQQEWSRHDEDRYHSM